MEDYEAIRAAAIFAAGRAGLFPAPFSSVFRYVNLKGDKSWAHLEDALLRNQLSLSKANLLNDPFDSNPVIVNDVTIQDINVFLDEIAARTNSTSFSSERMKICADDGRVLNGAELERQLVDLISNLYMAQGQVSSLASFSRRISSQLLWSHYAGGYAGLAYHFIVRPGYSSCFNRMVAVRYTRQRPVVAISEMMDNLVSPTSLYQKHLSFLGRAYLTKSDEWSYEEEERILGNTPTVTFAENELVALIIGPRFPEEDLMKLRGIIDKRSRPVKLIRATISETDYAIEVQWSSPI